MNHQNATKSETSPKSNRELAFALRAMALATQDPSPIFELNVDCWEEIFDWLSVDDVHAFGQTCKFFNRIAGKYFEWKYRRVLAQVYNNGIKIYWKDLPGFIEFAQRLSISVSRLDPSVLCAFENCKSPKELQIRSVRSCVLEINCFEKMLASVEIIKLEDWSITNEHMESILKICATNLKRLTIRKPTRCDWMHLKYPKLQHLELSTFDSAQELVQFFEASPNLRNFTTEAGNILKYQEELSASNIKLDDLTVLGDTTMDGIPNALIDLYNRGFYKRLHFTTFTKNHLEDLFGLTTLHVGTYDYIDLPNLPTVTRMSFRPLQDGLCSWLNMDEVTNALTNLECVLMRVETSMEYMMPFIRNSKKLKEIKMQCFRNDYNGDIDPVLMDSHREKLKNTHKVTIYVEEQDYLRIKWKYSRSDFGLIEIKRHESYDGMLDHCFD